MIVVTGTVLMAGPLMLANAAAQELGSVNYNHTVCTGVCSNASCSSVNLHSNAFGNGAKFSYSKEPTSTDSPAKTCVEFKSASTYSWNASLHPETWIGPSWKEEKYRRQIDVSKVQLYQAVRCLFMP